MPKTYPLMLVLLLSITTCLSAQQTETDSLLNILERTRSEEKKADLYLSLSESLYDIDPDSAMHYAGMAVTLAQKTGERELLARAYRQLGIIYNLKDEEEKALEELLQAREIFMEEGNREMTGVVNNNLSSIYYYLNDFDMAMAYAGKALSIGEDINKQEIIATSYFLMGNISKRKNNYDDAIDYYFQSLEIRRELGDKDEIASVLNNIGSFYMERSDYEKAMQYLEETLEMRRQLNSPRSTGIVLNNLGNVNLELGQFNKAIEYYREASEIFREIGFDIGTAATLTGMATIYERLGQYESALDVYEEIMEVRKKDNNPWEMANAYSNISIIYYHILMQELEEKYGKNPDEYIYRQNIKVDMESAKHAIEYGLKALELRRDIDDKSGISISLVNLGMMFSAVGELEEAEKYWEEWMNMPSQYKDDSSEKIIVNLGLGTIHKIRGNYSKAQEFLDEAYAIAGKVDDKRFIVNTSRKLADLYEKQNNYRLALRYYKLLKETSDTLIKMDTRKQINEMQVKYETEAQKRKNELLKKDQMLTEAKLRLRNKALVASIIILLIFVVMLIQLIRQNNFRKKANRELEIKNQLITAQKKEITDSIEYASRIQTAVLPPEDYIRNLIQQQFIVYRPRDIVSGDFYWMTEKNGRIITIIADCTGHGVPGAFMSMLGVAFLNEIISKHDRISTDMVLDELRKQVIDSLHQTGKEGESQDGMDVSLFILDRENMKLQFSGANNSMVVCRNGELIELKADKMPIGIHTRAGQAFGKKEMDLQKGDMLYAFTDGYPDQFGGPRGKKFMIRNFKKLLASIKDQPVADQKRVLENTLDDWMANTTQVDDILVMGIRV